MNVVQRVDNTLQVATKAKLVTEMVVFPCSMVCIVVGGVAIHESVREEAVERHAPILRAGEVLMVGPLRGIIQSVRGVLSRVEIPWLFCFIVP